MCHEINGRKTYGATVELSNDGEGNRSVKSVGEHVDTIGGAWEQVRRAFETGQAKSIPLDGPRSTYTRW